MSAIKKKIKLINELKQQFENYPIKWGFNGLSYAVYKRTYARELYSLTSLGAKMLSIESPANDWIYHDEIPNEHKHNIKQLIESFFYKSRKEELHETIARCLIQCIEMGIPYTNSDIEFLFKGMMDLKGLFSGRFLWQAHSKLAKLGIGNSFANCYYYSLDNLMSVVKLFNQLALGGGVGFGVQKRFIEQMPTAREGINVEIDNELSRERLKAIYKANDWSIDDTKFLVIDDKFMLIVGDSREGWVDALEELLMCCFLNNTHLHINTRLVRDKGEAIGGFGGVASGDEELIKGFNQIISIIKNAEGRKLNSVEWLDICCILGSIIVSGNVRRSALIATADSDDIEFIKCKRFDLITVPSYRQFVNITLECNDINSLPHEYWDSYEQLGECIGLLNSELIKNYGRLGKFAINDIHSYYENINYEKFNVFHKDIHSEFYFVPKLNNYEGRDFFGNSELIKADPMAVSCNPCKPRHALLLAIDGVKRLKDLSIGDTIWSGFRWTKITDIISRGRKKVKKYLTTAGYVELTSNHKVLSKGDILEVGEATFLDKANGIDFELEPISDISMLDGLLIGDGSNCNGFPYLCIGAKDQDYYNESFSESFSNKHSSHGYDMVRINSTNIEANEIVRTYLRTIPERLFTKDFNYIRGLLRGLYSANGSMCGNRITLKQASFELILQVQQLLSALNINSYYTTNKSKKVEFRNGEYECKQSYDLNITQLSSKLKFKELIGFIQKYKQEKLELLTQKSDSPFASYTNVKSSFEIKEVIDMGIHEVFDITVEAEEHSYWNYGFLVKNCGEANLASGELCNLATTAINKFENFKEWSRFSKLLYMYQKQISQMSFLYDSELINSMSRLGQSVCGFTKDFDKNIKWMEKQYKILREFDIKYSAKMNFPPSIKLTAIKPEGTMSLVFGVSAGIHADFSEYYFRTVTFASSNPLLSIFEHLNYRVEDKINIDGSIDKTSKVVYFACKADNPNYTEDNMTIKQQIDYNIRTQEAFCDQSISQTVKWKKSELEDIKECLRENYNDKIKTISFLMDGNHELTFKQMPLQKITKQEYEEYVAKVGVIDRDAIEQYIGHSDNSAEDLLNDCSSGACPTR